VIKHANHPEIQTYLGFQINQT